MSEQVATPEIAPVEEEKRELPRALVPRRELVRPEFKYQVAMTVAERKSSSRLSCNFEAPQPWLLVL